MFGLVFGVLKVALMVGLPVVGILYGAYRFVRFLEERLLDPAARENREFFGKMEEAHQLATRIQGLLPASEGGEPGAFARELGEVVDERLPAALDRQRRLLEYLGRKDRARVVREEREIRRKLSGTADPELEKLLERNLEMAGQRLENLQRLELASRKADAQIRALLMNLEALEDRLVASEFAKVGAGDMQIEALVEDVKLLEAAYEEIDLE